MIKADVAIVGGGLVGLSTAVAMADRLPEARIVVIDRGSLEGLPEAQLDVRSSALTSGSWSRLKGWGVDVDKTGLTPIRSIHVSATKHWGGNSFNAADHDLASFGYVVENSKLQAELVDVVTQNPRITLLPSHTVTGTLVTEDYVQLDLQGHEVAVQSKLLLISDGSRSQVASRLGVAFECVDFQQHAIVCNVKLAAPHHGCARERFSDGMPLAMLPLGDDVYAVVWCLSPAEARRVMSLDSTAFCQELSGAAVGRVGTIQSVGKRTVFPLVASRSKEIYRRRIAIMGNAAHTLHPVAGQGLNLCIRDIDQLARQFESIDALGEVSRLQQWSNVVSPDQSVTWDACHSLVKAFSVRHSVSTPIRSSLMYLLGVTPMASDAFLKKASDVRESY